MKRLLILVVLMGNLKASSEDFVGYLCPWVAAMRALAPMSTENCVQLTNGLCDDSEGCLPYNKCTYCILNFPRKTGCGCCCLVIGISCLAETSTFPVRNCTLVVNQQPASLVSNIK